MENQLSSIGIFSQDVHHCRFIKGSRLICKDGILNQKNLRIVSSSCPCSMTLIGQRRETKRNVFQIRPSQDVREEVFAWTLVVFLVLETKRCGMETAITSVASQVALQAKETRDPVFTGSSPSSCGILKRLKGEETTRFNADASNTELLFQVIHQANQLSIYKKRVFTEQCKTGVNSLISIKVRRTQFRKSLQRKKTP